MRFLKVVLNTPERLMQLFQSQPDSGGIFLLRRAGELLVKLLHRVDVPGNQLGCRRSRFVEQVGQKSLDGISHEIKIAPRLDRYEDLELIQPTPGVFLWLIRRARRPD